jgi:hypothetical protein
MNPKGYLIFHLNLAFSSIEEEARPEVIKKCYYPLLELVEQTGIPIGIELTGWTLQEIRRLDPKWVSTFSAMLEKEECELIGSGWTQMIGPLVPMKVNQWNQKLGVKAYKKILGQVPQIVLVNEMAYSSGMVDVYAEAGYQGIVMDRDNVRLALGKTGVELSGLPTYAQGHGENSLPIIWGDSILFQRLQRAVHGDIPVKEYLDYVKTRAKRDAQVLPIYCNDVEIFDFRPGRFDAESRLQGQGEWNRLQNLCTLLQKQVNLQWLSPGQVLAQIKSISIKRVGKLSTATYPIPVKKQAKYNIGRWALTGRDDLWLNTRCYQVGQYLVKQKITDPFAWQQLCELWASDLRTHITDERWAEAIEKLDDLNPPLDPPVKPQTVLPEVNTSLGQLLPMGATIVKDEDEILWTVNTPHLRLIFDVRRGLTIHSLAFASQDFEPILGTISQGYFDSIELGADFYSGGVLVEIPGERRRLTDLDWVEPEVQTDSKSFIFSVRLPFGAGHLVKVITISLIEERLSFRYEFEALPKPLGIVRVGLLTLIPEGWSGALSIQTHHGGELESFLIDRDFDHGKPASTMVSSSAGLGMTEGIIHLLDERGLRLTLIANPGLCATLPMLMHRKSVPSHLTRIAFSLCELDDTSRPGGRLMPFELTLLSPQVKNNQSILRDNQKNR